MAKIKQNNYVLFFYNDSKKWLAKISKNEQLHTHIGVIKHSDAIGKEYGSRLVTNKDKYVYLFEPTIHDFVMKIQHGTQIVYPKDLGDWYRQRFIDIISSRNSKVTRSCIHI